MNTIKAMNAGRQSGGGRMSLKQAARQMGLDSSQLDENAEKYWEMLNKMSTNNPEGYEAYLKQQMEEAKKAEQAPPRKKRRGFRPKAGFVVASAFQGGGSGSAKGKSVLVNVCSFEGVEMPIDASGKPVDGDAKVNLTGLSIPLAVSPSREVSKHSTLYHTTSIM